MSWEKKAIELPEELRTAVRDRANKLGGDKRGMLRYVWTLAGMFVMDLDENTLRIAANRLRDEDYKNKRSISHLLGKDNRVPMVDLLDRMTREDRQKAVEKLFGIARRIARKPGSNLSEDP